MLGVTYYCLLRGIFDDFLPHILGSSFTNIIMLRLLFLDTQLSDSRRHNVVTYYEP
jgi:hypothetical protein